MSGSAPVICNATADPELPQASGASGPGLPQPERLAARCRLIWLVLAAGVLPAAVSLAAALIFGSTPRVNERAHVIFELVGSCIAFGVAMLLLVQTKRERGAEHLLWMAGALTATGLIDGAHAVAPFGIEWSWLRHGATLVGGVLAGLVWLRVPEGWAHRGRYCVLGAGVVSVAAVLAIWACQWAGLLPEPWSAAGGYIPLVKVANAVGGVGFLSAAVFFLRRYLRRADAQDLVFGGHAVLLSVAGLMFGFSRVWAVDWWLWHGFRLLAFGVVLLAAYRIVLGVYERMAGQAAELATAKERLEERVAERTGKLRESEEKYRLLFDTMTEGFGLNEIVLDANGKPCDWRFLELNAAWEQQTGMSRAETLGKTKRQVWPDLDASWVEKFGRVALSGEPFHSEGYNPHLQRWFEVFAYRTRPNQFAVVFSDITERKRAEEALRESEERLRLAAEGVDLGIWDLDLRTNLATRTLRHDQIFGYKELQPVWTLEVALKHLLPEDRDGAVKAHQAARETGHLFHESRVRWPDGSVHWISARGRVRYDGRGQPARIAGVVMDVTERKEAELALEDSEARLRLALEAAQLGTFEFRFPAGEIVWDEQMRRIWGVGAEEKLDYAGVVGRVHPEDRERVEGLFAAALRPESDGYYTAEYRVLWPDMSVHWTSSRGRVQFEGEGQSRGAVRMVGIEQDITRQKEFEAELQRLVGERTARLQELVGELEHFSYTITHDLKSPLRAMRGFAEIAGQASGPGEAKPFLEKISTSAERMDRLIADALSYSRSVRQELPLEDVDAGALLRGMLDSYPEFQPVKAQIRVEGVLPVVLGNEAGLTQCLSNLLGNAVKFVKAGEKPDVRVWAEERGEWVRIWVEDKGIGISKEMLPRVFEMFSRGSKDYEGTGIGLALVRKVVQRMGGKVGVESEEGKGSRFWIELKSGERKALLTGDSVRLGQEPGAGGVSVLYVEDEESDAMFMERAFAQKGLGEKLRLARTGRAAIDYLSGSGEFGDREKYPVPSLVLLDLNLPQVSGFGVLEWIRNHPDYARLPVVVFSSSTREDDRLKAERLGANELVPKPSSGVDFGKVVEGLKSKWMASEARF